ncbi:hypothetical protein NBRC111894_1919 [Sporolactobacillus inulinus]|uniref:Uncharacterized protein n=1 Tax=Sporolactobacillus inulinus TaxID=2078 RepID=A0A4Y1ZBD5_9BACL|nr:hypothetical protein NBRC111894_1919 [Sporolactobacillus inulinus]
MKIGCFCYQAHPLPFSTNRLVDKKNRANFARSLISNHV